MSCIQCHCTGLVHMSPSGRGFVTPLLTVISVSLCFPLNDLVVRALNGVPLSLEVQADE